MPHEQQTIEHRIWLTAYLTALRTHEPAQAQEVATSAVERYQLMWHGFKQDAQQSPQKFIPRYSFSEMDIPEED